MQVNKVRLRPEDMMRDTALTAIQKVGAAIINDKNMALVVRKKTQSSQEYFMAGGRMEAEETQKETLVRELKEELGVEIASMDFIDSFEDIGVFEREPIIIHAYVVRIHGQPRAQSEIIEYIWIDKDFEKRGFAISSIMATKVIPWLVSQNNM